MSSHNFLATARAAWGKSANDFGDAPRTHSPVANIKALLGFDSVAPSIVAGQVAGQVENSLHYIPTRGKWPPPAGRPAGPKPYPIYIGFWDPQFSRVGM